MDIKSIEPGINIPEKVYVIVEITKNSCIKYEINKNNKVLYVNRIINTLPYPFNYGYINKTYSLDKDELDAIIITEYNIFPKSVILCKPIGILIMNDESGNDNKIICVPDDSINEKYKNINSINNISDINIKEILFFFENYKKLDKNKWSKVIEIKDEFYAKKEILLSIKRFNNIK